MPSATAGRRAQRHLSRRRVPRRLGWRWPRPAAASSPRAARSWRAAAAARRRERGRRRGGDSRDGPAATSSHWAEYDDPDADRSTGSATSRSTSTTRTRRPSRSSRPPGARPATTWWSRPAPTSRRWSPNGPARGARPGADPELQEPRHALHEPAVGPGQQVLGVQGLGHDRLDLRQHRHHDAHQRPGTTSSTRRMAEASGNMSVLDAPTELTGIYFWANGIDWNTDGPGRPRRVRGFMVNEFAPHIKAFDSYPGINLTQGNYALSQVWNGDARQGSCSSRSRRRPAKYTWGSAHRKTELWMDNWTIVKGAKNLDAAYDFINYILDPANSLPRSSQFHGYNTGVKGIEEPRTADTQFLDMIFFTTPSRRHDAGAGDQRGAGPPGRDLQQGEGRRGRADDGGWSRPAGRGLRARCPEATPRRRGSPLALPGVVWYSSSSSSRSLSSSSTASATRSGHRRAADRDRPAVARHTTARRSRDTFLHVFSQTLRISILGTAPVPPDRLPVRLLARDREGDPAVARACCSAS